MRMTLKPFGFAAALALAGLVACTSGTDSAPPPAPVPAAMTLAYTNPASSGWRLVKDASSTPTRVVLNLVGPSGTRTRGVGFNLKAPAGARFGTFTGGLPIQDAGVYQLHAFGSTDPNEPVALAGGLKAGNLLSVGIYQKDRDQPAQDSGVALCRIAVTLDTAAGIPAGTALPLSVLKAKVIPEDIGAFTDDLWTLDRKMRMADITIATGTLTAQ
ncbi:MAG TPA: hypothetical protein VK188_12180 [Holophaga sp.]|nr:hypothetical protein [Holophaga sp.]